MHLQGRGHKPTVLPPQSERAGQAGSRYVVRESLRLPTRLKGEGVAAFSSRVV